MTKLYNIYIEDEFHLDYLFKINSQILELYDREIKTLGKSYNYNQSRRIFLVTTGEINHHVKNKILTWNKRRYIPIEAIDGFRFSRFLIETLRYEIENFDTDIFTLEKGQRLGNSTIRKT